MASRMRHIAVSLITVLAIALLIGTIAYVVSAEAPASMNIPASASMPTSTPVITPEPSIAPEVSPELTPTTMLAATPTLEPTLILSPILDLPAEIGSELDDNNVVVHYGEQPPYTLTRDGDDRVRPANNGTAIDPTWQQLESFLIADKTDERNYIPDVFMCGAFAEELHNKAEAAGIKAAWVSVSLLDKSERHALNAFNTTDRGLVYIDCSGQSTQNSTQIVGMNSTSLGGLTVYGGASSWDKIAYVAVGKELGFVSLDFATCPEYVCYENYVQRKSDFEAMLNDYNQRAQVYNSEVLAFNEWVSGKVFIEGTSDAARARQWSEQLKQEKDSLTTMASILDQKNKSLGAFWQTLGIVSGVDIYW